MNRKIYVVFLSVLAVIFAVSSAFAVVNDNIDMDIDDMYYDADTELLTGLTTEGYTYTNKLVLTGDGLETSTRTYTLSDMNIDWLVSGENTDWLQLYTASDDQVLIMEGKIPAYSYASEYNIQVIATASVNIRNQLHEKSDDVSVVIRVDRDTTSSGNIITPALSYTDIYTPYFSFDQSVTPSPYRFNENYDVHLIIPADDEGILAAYLPEVGDLALNANISLPLWISFDIVASRDYDSSYYPTDIRFFYVSPDYVISEDISLPVKIISIQNFDALEDGLTDADYVMSWNIAHVIEDTKIIIDSDDISFDFACGETDSADITYTGSAPVSWTISKDTSATIESSDLGLKITSDDEKGTITITVKPTSAGKYTGVITFTASDKSSADIALTVNVDPVLVISEDTLTVSAEVGRSNTGTIHFTSSSNEIVSYDAAPNVPQSLSLDISSGDKTITFRITPVLSLDYTGKFTFYASDGASDDVTVNLRCLSRDQGGSTPIVPETPAFAVSEPGASERTIQIEQGTSRRVNIVTNNGSGDITWGTPAVTPNAGITVTLSPMTGYRTTATITADSNATNGTATITATDGAGKRADVTLTITIPGQNTEPDDDPNNTNTEPYNPNQAPEPGQNDTPSETNPDSPVYDVDIATMVGNARSALGINVIAYTAAPSTVSANNNRELSGVPSSLPENAISVLPVMRSIETAVYIFNVNKYLGDAQPGDMINVYVKQVRVGNASASALSSGGEAVLVDSTGKGTSVVPEDGIVNMAIYMEEGNYYSSAITHMAEGTGPGDPKGGCSASGLGAFALMFALPLFFRKKI